MSKKEDEAYAAWVEDLAEKVEPTEAEAFKVWAKTPAAREVFRGTIGQAELYRRFNELDREKKDLESAQQELQTWYEEEQPKNAALIEEREALKKQLAELGSGGPPPAATTPAPLIAPEELAELRARANKVEVLDKLIPAVLGDMSRVVKDSIKNDFDVDPGEVIQYSLKNSVEPWRAYLELTSDERQKRGEKAQEEERKKWIEEGRRQALSTHSPDHLQPSGPSVVDYLKGLNQAANAQGATPNVAPNKDSRVSAALKEFYDEGGNFPS